MEHDGSAANQGSDLLVVANVGALEIDPAADLGKVVLVAGQQVVDDDDVRGALVDESAHDCGTDEAGSSGYNVVAHDGSWAISDSR